MYFIWYILIGILSGFIAGKIMRGGGFGILINLLVGVERYLEVESDRFAIREESKGFSDDVFAGYFQFPFQ